MNTKPSFSQTKILTLTTRLNNSHSRFGISSISGTLSPKPFYFGVIKAAKETTTTTIEPSSQKNSIYEDSFFSKIAINYLSKTYQEAAGMSTNSSDKISGYDGLVDTSIRVASNLDTKQQHELVLLALDRSVPEVIRSLIKTLPSSKRTRELFAVFTTIFFTWLVGPSEVKETEVDGIKEKSVVYIKKCRFLEQTNCVGMCTHLCKIPSQTFIKDSLGMPVYMKPDFNDLSCEMMFGQDPPKIEDDPVTKQPCLQLCKSNSYGAKHKSSC